MNPPSAVVLRPARLTEATGMAHLSRELIERGLVWRYTPTRMAALVADADTLVLVALGALDDAAVQGFAVMPFGDTDAHLSLLCVQAAAQRQGIGRQLMHWLLASARVAGLQRVRLELREDNVGALAFYRALGFELGDRVPAYCGGNVAALRMVLRLRAAG
jgi:[ribosomal protein S18]-alanine N-acetyltransferase